MGRKPPVQFAVHWILLVVHDQRSQRVYPIVISRFCSQSSSPFLAFCTLNSYISAWKETHLEWQSLCFSCCGLAHSCSGNNIHPRHISLNGSQCSQTGCLTIKQLLWQFDNQFETNLTIKLKARLSTNSALTRSITRLYIPKLMESLRDHWRNVVENNRPMWSGLRDSLCAISPHESQPQYHRLLAILPGLWLSPSHTLNCFLHQLPQRVYKQPGS